MADQNSPFAFPFADMLKNIHAPGFDPDAILESQRKNLEALSRASQITAEGMSNVARRHMEYLNESMDELSAATEKLADARDTQDMLTQQGELINNAYERALANMRELADMISESNAEAFDTISRRIEESINELNTLAEKGGDTRAKK